MQIKTDTKVTEVRFVFLDVSPDDADKVCDEIANWLDMKYKFDYLITEAEDITGQVAVYDTSDEG
jgi:hypothetical protein